MSGPRVTFNGKTVNVPAQGLRKSGSAVVLPEDDADGTIFVSVASYRGKRT